MRYRTATLFCMPVLALACSREAHEPAGATAPITSIAPPAAIADAAPAGPAPPAPPMTLRESSEVSSHVGEVVTLVGTQTRTRQPTVLGVDVDADDALAMRTVRVTGVLRRTVIDRDPNEGAAPGEVVATRGPGTYHSIHDPRTGRLAKPVLEQ